jgi:hypothetical protein
MTTKPFATVIDAETGETYTRELTAEEITELPTSTETDIPQDETPTAG